MSWIFHDCCLFSIYFLHLISFCEFNQCFPCQITYPQAILEISFFLLLFRQIIRDIDYFQLFKHLSGLSKYLFLKIWKAGVILMHCCLLLHLTIGVIFQGKSEEVNGTLALFFDPLPPPKGAPFELLKTRKGFFCFRLLCSFTLLASSNGRCWLGESPFFPFNYLYYSRSVK